MILPLKFGNGALKKKSGLVLDTFQAIKIQLQMQRVGGGNDSTDRQLNTSTLKKDGLHLVLISLHHESITKLNHSYHGNQNQRHYFVMHLHPNGRKFCSSILSDFKSFGKDRN